jgi:cobalt/nickel transport system permease protein
LRQKNVSVIAIAGFLSGVAGIAFGTLLIAFALISTGESFTNVATVIAVTHLPIMVIEGVITAFCLAFLKKVKPEILEVSK